MWTHDDEEALAEALYQYDYGQFRGRPWETAHGSSVHHAYEARARRVLEAMTQRGWQRNGSQRAGA